MNRIDELIREYCPDGVEIRYLEDCCNLLDKKRKPITKASREAGEYPYYGANGIQDYVANYIFDGTYVLVGEDGSVITKEGTPVVTWAKGKIWVNNHAHIIEEKEGVMLRYLYHYLQTIDVTSLIHGNIPKLTGGDFKALKIAVPPLEVQREIVRVLDSFTLLTAELTAELTARKKQYNFYRDTLIQKEHKSEKVKLNTICEIYDGTHQTPKYTNSGIPFVSVENIDDLYGTQKFISPEAYAKYKIKPRIGDVFMTRITAGVIGKCTVVDRDDDLAYYVSLALLRPNANILDSKYLKYYLESGWGRKELSKWILWDATPTKINKDDIGRVLISVPPLDTQKRLVQVIEHFDAICTDLNIGLPAEIEARQKQYEYYRDLLLTFAETGSTLMTDRQTDRQTELSAIKLIQYVFGYVSIELGAIATVTKLAGYEFTKYVTYSDEGKIIALRGLNVKNGKLDLTDVKYIDKSDLTKLNRSKLCSGDMLFTYVGTIGQVAVINENDKYYLAPNVALIRVDTQFVNPEYMRYFFQTNVFWNTQINRLLQSSSMKNIPMEKIRKFILQIPSIEEQNRIVEVLNRFDTLCNDLSTGLPAEIEARQKQYEYYRDKLLSFKELPK